MVSRSANLGGVASVVFVRGRPVGPIRAHERALAESDNAYCGHLDCQRQEDAPAGHLARLARGPFEMVEQVGCSKPPPRTSGEGSVPGRCRRGQPCQAGWNQLMPRSPSGGLNRLVLTGGARRLLSDVCRPSASPARLARGPGGGQPPLAVPERPARRETSHVGVEEAHIRKRRRARRGRREVPRSRRGPQCLRPADPRSHRAGAGLKDVTADEIHLPTSGSS